MTRQNAIKTQQQAAGTSPLSKGGILQRQCESCGQHTIAGGECGDCGKKKIGLQRKLTIGASNDPLELEADRVADLVMAASTNSVVSSAPISIQRFTGQTSGQSEMVAPASVESVLSSPGSPLELGLQEDMSQRFGHDFSRVRVHTGDDAARSARDVDAKAYTVGHNLVFGDGWFAPRTHEGKRLIAHELTHVIQQSGSGENHLSKDKIHAHSLISYSANISTGLLLQRQSTKAPNLSIRSPLFEETVTVLSDFAAANSGRSLTIGELALIRGIFRTSIDYSPVRLIPSDILEYRTVGNSIWVPQNFSIQNPDMAQTLVHEMTHIWQYQHGGTSYISISLGTQIAAMIGQGNRNFAYDYQISTKQSFFDFTIEQQASIVENYFAMIRDQATILRQQLRGLSSIYNSNHLGTNGYRKNLSDIDRQSEISSELPLHETLIQQMRSSLPQSEANILQMRASEVMKIPKQDFLGIPTERQLIPVRPLLEVRF
jgi:Domain of unknown function (DUF4157)